MADIQKAVAELASYDVSKYGPDFLRTWDKDDDSIKATLTMAQLMRDLYYEGISPKLFDSGIGISIFKDNSTRTRYSHASATNLLGLLNQELDMGKSQVAHGETTLETANMIAFLTRSVGIRDDMFLGVGQKYMQEFAKSLDVGYKEGVLAQRPTVVNLQCDEDHPTQSMSDMAFLINHYGGLENLKGKKLVMSWAYSPSYGKPLSVPQGVIALMTRMGMDITLAYPEGYNLIPEIEQMAADNASKNGSNFEIVHDMKKSFEDADIVYPKSWAPYHVMQKRTELLIQNDEEGLKALEKEALANNAKYKDWECDEDKMSVTKSGEALYMHCLPADISAVSCKEGEVTKGVFDKYRKETYIEASYKPFVIAAMIALGQFGTQTADVMNKILNNNVRLKMSN